MLPADPAVGFYSPWFRFSCCGLTATTVRPIRAGFVLFQDYDRGRTWQGPHCFMGLNSAPELSGLILTPRTDALIEGSHACLLMLSARPDHAFTDRVFCARTRDGGQTFQWVGWLVPPSDPYRAVMPATVSGAKKSLVSVIRRRAVPEDRCWIDAYGSGDGGLTWEPLEKWGTRAQETAIRRAPPTCQWPAVLAFTGAGIFAR